ncbi:alpha/beta hydrolase [Nocardia sp. NPDC024068]|uniref:alpha/beta fold hydrolase n=1 Tax=Nocardia sp. NPDC024068 TaxID=3157197 RepID=UPI0033E61FA4
MENLNRALERDGGVVRFRDLAGERRAVVFTHGAGMDHTVFETQAKALHESGHRVVVWDQRGHGESTLAPGHRFTAAGSLGDLVALIEQLDLERPILIGHSLGGNLSQELARTAPERVYALIAIGSTWNAGPLSSLERTLLKLAAPSLALVPAAQLPRLMARASAVTPEAIAACETVFARMPKRTFLDVWRATVSLVDPSPDYRTPVPLGLIRGDHDRTGNIATAMAQWAQAEEVAEHIVPDAGHVVTLDAPEAATREIRGMINAWESAAEERCE